MTRIRPATIVPIGLSFCTGLAAGCAIALLFTPYSGPEARARIKAGVASGKTKVNQEAENFKRKSEELATQAVGIVDAGKRRVTAEVRRLDAAVQAGKEALRRPAVVGG